MPVLARSRAPKSSRIQPKHQAEQFLIGGNADVQVPFHADHAFAWLIRDTTTGEILFYGRVVDPTVR
jgi:serine protease inhibitor